MKSEPSLLLPVYVTHIVMHYASPSPLDATLVEWKSRVFSSTPVSDYSDGRTGRTEGRRKRESGINGLITFLSLLSFSAAVFEPLAPKRGEEQERDRSPCNRSPRLGDKSKRQGHCSNFKGRSLFIA